MVIKVATSDIFQEKVDTIIILEHIVHAKYERVIRLKEDLFFIFSILNLLFVNKNIFVNSFHRI